MNYNLAEAYQVLLIRYAIDELNFSYILWWVAKVEKHVSVLFFNLLNHSHNLTVFPRFGSYVSVNRKGIRRIRV